MQISFFQRVINVIISSSTDFKKNFVDYDYLLLSEGFSYKKHYLIKTTEGNYLHLTGISTSLTPTDFFKKCLNGSIQISDIENNPEDVTKLYYKGLIRKKIQVLSEMSKGIDNTYLLEENFTKNRVSCSIASANSNLTLGFVSNGNKEIPMSLLKGNLITPREACNIDFMLRTETNKNNFDCLVIGNSHQFKKHLHKNEYLEELINGNIKECIK
ncbi:MAG: hypothetical protein QM489_04990 [Candidatus Izemoplasma sp.]